MKWITRLSLFLVFFLLMGDSHLRLHEQDCIDCRSSENPANHAHLHYHSVERNHFLYVRSRPAGTRKSHFGVDAAMESKEENEDDENESSSAKRNVNTGNYFTTAFYLQPLSILNVFLGKSCSQVQHFLYYSSYRYIVFRVIRI